MTICVFDSLTIKFDIKAIGSCAAATITTRSLAAQSNLHEINKVERAK